MKIVIEIDDKLYDRIKYLEPKADTMLDRLMRAVQNGTPLPTCEDCISRQAVEDAIANTIVNGESLGYAVAYDILCDLPPVKPQPKWIPVSERLPEDCTEVFVYLFDRPSPYIAWIEDTHWYTEEFEVERENEPIAWMPLPKQYVPDTNVGEMGGDTDEDGD